MNYAIYSDLHNHDDVDDDGNYIVAPTGPLVAGQLIAMHCSGPESWPTQQQCNKCTIMNVSEK